MRNTKLADLNFNQLLKYGGQPKVQNTYNPSLKCTGYCTLCEEKGVFWGGQSFDLMSHGCDTADFESLLGELPNRKLSLPICFY